jgi:hypothetical protein
MMGRLIQCPFCTDEIIDIHLRQHLTNGCIGFDRKSDESLAKLSKWAQKQKKGAKDRQEFELVACAEKEKLQIKVRNTKGSKKGLREKKKKQKTQSASKRKKKKLKVLEGFDLKAKIEKIHNEYEKQRKLKDTNKDLGSATNTREGNGQGTGKQITRRPTPTGLRVGLGTAMSTNASLEKTGTEDMIMPVSGTKVKTQICELCGNRFNEDAYQEHIFREHHKVEKKVSWEILNPSSEYRVKDLVNHFKSLQGLKSERIIQWERLEKLDTLNPKTVYVGSNEFMGYVVYVFGDRQKVILECPMPGNATYLISGNWRELTQRRKTDLMNNCGESVERVIHRGSGWFQNVKAKLFGQHRGDSRNL